MFKTGEIKLIANDDIYKRVITQNTVACLRAFECNCRTLLSYYDSFSNLSHNNLRIKREDRREARGPGGPAERPGEAQGGAGAELGIRPELRQPQSQELSWFQPNPRMAGASGALEEAANRPPRTVSVKFGRSRFRLRLESGRGLRTPLVSAPH